MQRDSHSPSPMRFLSICVVRPLHGIHQAESSITRASERAPLPSPLHSTGFESKPNPPFYSFRSVQVCPLLTRLLNETFKLAPLLKLPGSMHGTADYVLFKHQFGPPPRRPLCISEVAAVAPK